MEGVTGPVLVAMEAVGANVLTEDGFLLRTCEHGIRHLVGRLDDNRFDATHEHTIKRHEILGPRGGALSGAKCDGCCAVGEPRALDEAQSVTT